MIRHIFIATIKDGISDEVVGQKMSQMRAMKDSVTAIKHIWVGKSLGLAGPANTVSMIVDVEDKAGLDALLASEAHRKISNHAGEAFRTDNFVMSQITISD